MLSKLGRTALLVGFLSTAFAGLDDAAALLQLDNNQLAPEKPDPMMAAESFVKHATAGAQMAAVGLRDGSLRFANALFDPPRPKNGHHMDPDDKDTWQKGDRVYLGLRKASINVDGRLKGGDWVRLRWPNGEISGKIKMDLLSAKPKFSA
mmetsp:Transcript_80947/g.214920  ORF Transcript_80947/g.214920 Transcript_80947/m.214920 type:complete len:150 (-) Transcript_80947:128-577(-)